MARTILIFKYMTLLQVEQLSQLSAEAVKAAGQQDPGTSLAFYVLIAAVIAMSTVIIALGRFLFQDLKKKDKQIEEKNRVLIELTKTNTETLSSFEKAVDKLVQSQLLNSERQKESHEALLKAINSDHEYFKNDNKVFKEALGKLLKDKLL